MIPEIYYLDELYPFEEDDLAFILEIIIILL